MGYCPQIPVLSVLCPPLNLLNFPPRKKILGYATGREQGRKGSAGEHSSKFVSPSTKHYILIFSIPSSHPVLAQNVPGTLTCKLSIKNKLYLFHLANFRNTEITNKLGTSNLKRHRGLRTALNRAAHRAGKL